MKDAKGHGSEACGDAAHQGGVVKAIPERSACLVLISVPSSVQFLNSAARLRLKGDKSGARNCVERAQDVRLKDEKWQATLDRERSHLGYSKLKATAWG